ncbi:MAG: hypothetical protein HC921_18775 [Synechococcaceae cyanobacterium SM2_3_1]|nr:hypothetical protein [Synechococcaceae cyanobacterium SM2_3_1]
MANGVPFENCVTLPIGFDCEGLANVNRHWRESVFGASLMSTVIDIGVDTNINDVTLQFLTDIGYPAVGLPEGGELHTFSDATGSPGRNGSESPQQPSQIILSEDVIPGQVYVLDSNGNEIN